MKKILIFGGTGFIGRHLLALLKNDYKLVVFSRNPEKWKSILPEEVDLLAFSDDVDTLAGHFYNAWGIIHLAGENVGGGRWTPALKERILQSRTSVVNLIAEAFQSATKKPSFYIQGSATGYYGINPTDAEITESRPSTRDSFLTDVSVLQEEQADVLKDQTRLVFIRTGIVLDKEEGALPRIAMPFKLFAGGPVGNGMQWIPWIHIRDEVAAIKFIMEHENMHGPVNLTAPAPVRQKDFARYLGRALNRPSVMPAPAFALRLLLGKERAEDLLLSGLRIVPEKLLEAGFRFKYPDISDALGDLYE
jgi:uncharacterized protein (TIGR01777 family)